MNQFTHDMIRMTESERLIEYWTSRENDLRVKMKVNKSVYIPSIEAETNFDMSERGLGNITKCEYVGMISW